MTDSVHANILRWPLALVLLALLAADMAGYIPGRSENAAATSGHEHSDDPCQTLSET